MNKKSKGRRGITFDSGMLIALDRNSRAEWAALGEMVRQFSLPTVPAPVISEVWRSARQANVARALKFCRVEPTDAVLARSAGELCAAARTQDPVDAIVVASAAARGDVIWTSDPRDLRKLVAHVANVAIEPV